MPLSQPTTSGIPADGWVAAGETWTYASADDPTFTFTVAGVDLTGKYQPGQRIKLTQTTAKYFIITKVAFSTDTTITIYGGTDYDLANASITSPYWSPVKAPFGFPLDPTKWTVEVADTADRSQATPSGGTWYNLGSITISIPIGVWRVSYEVIAHTANTGSATAVNQYFTLSTANNSQSDTGFSSIVFTADANAAGKQIIAGTHREKVLALTSKTSYYLNAMTDATATAIHFRGDLGTTFVRAVCAYL